jgi:hypothetical protein
LILAYLDLSLIALAVANYAISASYLGRETRLSRKRMQSKEDKLILDLQNLRKKPLIEEAKKKIRDSERERNKLRIRIFLLSWLGAVVLPSMFSFLSFGSAVVGMNSETILVNNPQFLEQQSMIFSIGATAIGFMALFVVIKAVDSAAREIPLPKITVVFDNLLKTQKFKSKDEKILSLNVRNDGEDIAEDVEILVFFPPEFVIKTGIMGYMVYEQPIGSSHPHYKAVIMNVERIHIDTTLVNNIAVTIPEKKDTYTIPVSIKERKIGSQEDELTIEVVD